MGSCVIFDGDSRVFREVFLSATLAVSAFGFETDFSVHWEAMA